LDWFRMYSEARNDAKIRSLTDSQHRIWFNLLCLVNEQDNRGTVSGYDPELLAIEVSNGDIDALNETVQLLERLRIIEVTDEEITFINFRKRNYDNPSDTPEATRERKRQQRSRQKVEQSLVVTRSHDTYSDTDTDTDTDTNTPLTPLKKKYAEFVSLTNAEHKALVAKLGSEERVRLCIEILDNYKGANGKKYKSDYRAILNWVIKRLEEDEQKSGGKSPPQELTDDEIAMQDLIERMREDGRFNTAPGPGS